MIDIVNSLIFVLAALSSVVLLMVGMESRIAVLVVPCASAMIAFSLWGAYLSLPTNIWSQKNG